MNLTLRVYQKADREACVRIFRSNMPRFFAVSEEAEFAEFLDTEADENYFVVDNGGGGELLGCGGVFVAGGVAGLCWGMVDNTRHRRGIGTLLLRGRLEHLRAHHPQIKTVQLDTSQHSKDFFARFGFAVTGVTPDGYGPDLDRYDMTLSGEEPARLLSPQAP